MAKLDLNFVEDVVSYYNSNRSTVRETAKHFKISKSTVHRYLTEIMPNSTSREILEINKSERASRGGTASVIKRYKSNIK